jgi:hypothetical protein
VTCVENCQLQLVAQRKRPGWYLAENASRRVGYICQRHCVRVNRRARKLTRVIPFQIQSPSRDGDIDTAGRFESRWDAQRRRPRLQKHKRACRKAAGRDATDCVSFGIRSIGESNGKHSLTSSDIDGSSSLNRSSHKRYPPGVSPTRCNALHQRGVDDKSNDGAHWH